LFILLHQSCGFQPIIWLGKKSGADFPLNFILNARNIIGSLRCLLKDKRQKRVALRIKFSGNVGQNLGSLLN